MTRTDTFCQDELCEEKPTIKQEQHPIHPPTEQKSFGERLRDHRLRLGLSQEALASAIGASARSIHRWEQNLALPQEHSRSRLCHVFGIDSQQLLGSWLSQETSSATHPSPLWSVPFPRNPFFTGREETLATLHRQLGVDQVVALTQTYAMHGLGGVGKSQVALEYAYRHALAYRAIFWIRAETDEQVVSSLLRIAQTLQLPERDAKEQQRVVKAVQGWLYTHRQWLLIWDNVEDLTILDRFLPDTPHGAILLTTRYQTLGTRARGIHLRPMGHEEGMLLLLRRAKVLEAEATGEYLSQLAVQKPSQYTAAADLTTAMGGLPLALDQAGAYLEETQCGLPAYLELFRRRSAALLQLRGDGSRDHPASVSTTFTMAIAAITQRHPAVGELLRVCAFLQPDAIPEEVFLQGAEHLGETLKAVCHDPLDWNQVVAIACSYSLLFRQAEEQTFSLHRLVQAVLLDTMTEEEQERWSKQILCALEHVFPKQEHATWKQCERLLPHVLACLKRAEGSDSTLACASLAYKVALYLNVHGRYPEAEPLFLHALHTREHLLGPDHPHITSPLIDLAVLYLEQGKYAQAEPLLHRALYIREQAFGPDHYQVSSPLNNLALIYQKQGKYAQAEPLLLRSLHIRERTLGPEHPLVANLLNNLAILPWEQGLYTQAEPFFRRALHIWEKALGPDHPQVARALNNLGELSWKVGQPEQAEVLFQRALQIWEQALGSDHPLIAYPLHGLANLYSEQKGDAEVEQLFLRALSIREHHLGPHHPETAQTLHDLALYRKKQGNLDEALALAERALKISLQALGETHLKTVATQALYTQLTQERDHTEPNDASHQRKPTSIPERTSRTPL